MFLSHRTSLKEGSKYDAFLTDTYNDDNPPTVSELLLPGGKYYSDDLWDYNHKPGTYFYYSNINFGLVGTFIEAYSNLRFDTYMQ
jgi:CubicO group peptidase (beta-lactamase class C family)